MLNLALYDGLNMVKSGGKMFYDYGPGHTSPGYTASGTAAAAATLVKKLGADIREIVFLIELSFLKGREKLPGHPIRALVTY